MARNRSVLCILPLLTAGCFYTSTSVNFRELEARGVSTAQLDKRDESLRHFGHVRASQRTWLFGRCDAAADRAMQKLLEESYRRGGNRVLHARFRGHWKSIDEPVCRRNAHWLLLIVPAFLPVPSSVTVSGEAVYDPKFEAVSVVSPAIE